MGENENQNNNFTQENNSFNNTTAHISTESENIDTNLENSQSYQQSNNQSQVSDFNQYANESTNQTQLQQSISNSEYQQQNQFNNKQQALEPASPAPLILGILGFLGILIPLAGYAISIPGIVISVKDKKKPNSKYGVAGLVLSIIALCLSALIHIINIFLLASYYHY